MTSQDEIFEQNENRLFAWEYSNVCFVKTVFHDHIGHDYIGNQNKANPIKTLYNCDIFIL